LNIQFLTKAQTDGVHLTASISSSKKISGTTNLNIKVTPYLRLSVNAVPI
jgi:hypothetical protein